MTKNMRPALQMLTRTSKFVCVGSQCIYNKGIFRNFSLLHQTEQKRPAKARVYVSNFYLQSYSTSAPSENLKEGNAGENQTINSINTCDEAEGSEEYTLHLSEEDLLCLTQGDSECLKRVKLIQLEHEVLRQEGSQVPTKPIPLNKWKELLLLNSHHKRKKFYGFLFKLEKTKENYATKKEERRIQREEHIASKPPLPSLEEDRDRVTYGLNRNTYHLRLRTSTELAFYHNRLIQAMRFGQPLVIDCGYTDYMTRQESMACASQIELSFSRNRFHRNPFDLLLCNLDPEKALGTFLHRKMPVLYAPDFPMKVTSQSYLDLFPKEKLVYLTPHTRVDLTEFNDDEIYIIGGLVDKSSAKPHSLAKAKREGIKMRRLPLDRYVVWKQGNKTLTLNTMTDIMLEIKQSGSWESAFEFLPRRKLRLDELILDGENDDSDTEVPVLRPAKGVRGKVNFPQYTNKPSWRATQTSRYAEEF